MAEANKGLIAELELAYQYGIDLISGGASADDVREAKADLQKARAAVLARMAGPSEVVVPTRPDKGPFEWCGDDGDFIVSRDFIYDAGLKLSGDFPDDETKRAYMQRVMDILNAARPNNGGNDDQAA